MAALLGVGLAETLKRRVALYARRGVILRIVAGIIAGGLVCHLANWAIFRHGTDPAGLLFPEVIGVTFILLAVLFRLKRAPSS